MKLEEQMRQKIKLKGKSPKTFGTYWKYSFEFLRYLRDVNNDNFRKKSPSSANDLRWYWLFPSELLSRGEDGVLCRWHRHEDHIARQISLASKRAGIMTRVTSHVLRHSYATHAHEQGVPMRTLVTLIFAPLKFTFMRINIQQQRPSHRLNRLLKSHRFKKC